MKACEYAIVSLTAKFVGSEVIIYWPDGQETREETALTVVLNNMAAQGWEVVTSAGDMVFFTGLSNDSDNAQRRSLQ